jgi:hypothetical protein
VARRSAQRPGLGALFLLLGLALVGVAVEAGAAAAHDQAGLYVVAAAAGVLALWLLGLAVRLLRPR